MLGRAQTPAEKARREREKAERRRAREQYRAERAEREREEFEAMPEFVVRESREVTVKANSMNDAVALASAAFKEGQRDDFSIKWGRPWGVDGDTIDGIRTVNIKVVDA